MRFAKTPPGVPGIMHPLTLSVAILLIGWMSLTLCCTSTRSSRLLTESDKAQEGLNDTGAAHVSSRTKKSSVAQIIGKKRFVGLANLREKEQQLVSLPKRKRSEMILAGDQLEITLYEKLPVSQEKRIELKLVDEKGEIYLYPIGVLNIAGMTLLQARDTLEGKMKGYFITPFCEIVLVKRDYEPHVFVFGEAVRPGSFPLHGGDRLLDVLALSGGTTPKAFMASIKLVRLSGDSVEVLSIDLNAILKKGYLENNLVINDQDIIFIPESLLSSVTDVFMKLGSVLPWYYFLRNF
jgi:polysaccharide biosynthesis/export protein